MQWHWLLGPIGSKVIAAQRGVSPIRPAKVAVRWERLFHGWRYEELTAQHAWCAELVIHGCDLRHRWTVTIGHDRLSWRYDCYI
jgi:hypothetical protein